MKQYRVHKISCNLILGDLSKKDLHALGKEQKRPQYHFDVLVI